MFSFDGDFRRRPQQNLGGASQKSDRLSLIRRAQSERQKREDLRNQQHGATVIQCAVRSFLYRQQVKSKERNNFDNYVESKGLKNVNDLSYLLRRIIFFYYFKDQKDGERLIFICQYVIKNTTEVLTKSLDDRIWLYRIQRLLAICLEQIFIPDHSAAIPLRMLEIYTSSDNLKKYLPEENLKIYLEEIFTYLINKKYFQTVRQLIQTKIPTLDEETVQPPNQLSEAIFQMLLRPLKLVEASNDKMKNQILSSFIYNILSPVYSDQIKYFIIPSLQQSKDFPYVPLIKFLANHHQNQIIEYEINFNGDIQTLNRTSKKFKANVNDYNLKEPEFSSFLLYYIFKLDRHHLGYLNHNEESLGDYIKVIAPLTDHICKLSQNSVEPKEDSSDSDSDESSNDIDMLSFEEKTVLTEIIVLLNDTNRVNLVVNNLDKFLESPEIILCLCKVCHNLMTINRKAVFVYKILYTLACRAQFIRTLWYNLTSQIAQQGFSSPISLLSKGISVPKTEADKVVPILATFCALFGRLISTLNDLEFCQENISLMNTQSIMPFTIQEIISLSTTLKEISLGLVELAFPETRSNLNNYRSMINSLGNTSSFAVLRHKDSLEETNKNVWPHLFKVCISLLRQIHNRDLRKCFCPESHWTAHSLNLPLDKPNDLHFNRARRGLRPFQPIKDFTRDDLDEGPPLSTKQIRSITILKEIPFVVSFNKRVGVFQGLLAADKLRSQGEHQGFLQGPSIQLMVRRSHLYEDAFDKLSVENEPDLRPRFRIQMINSAGMEEAGIDGGGVFREFLSELIKTAFDPHRGFFMITKDNMLYPNPSVGKIVENFHKHYYFIGRILGKALYENLLVELPLAEFFLSKLAGKHTEFDVHQDQLASLDPILHRNLMSLKAYDGDVTDLGLDFTIVCDELGETKIVELKPNGANITVDSSNRIEYVQLMADFKLNKQIRAQCISFRQGLANVVPVEWLYMFSNKELQVLISGAEIPVDCDDLRLNTKYGGNYSPDHNTIKLFWRVVKSFTDIQRRQLLKFVTSCSRPPLLGFKDLDPAFCIQNAGDTDRLPSASTCMNLLKLPAFNSEDQLREKLLYAIQSGSGFELS